MSDPPLLPLPVTECAGTAHEEKTPTLYPAPSLVLSVRCGENRQHIVSLLIQILEPLVGRTLVVTAVHAPPLFDLHVVLKLQEQVIRRHHATGEEMASHPVARSAVFVEIWVIPMTEHV